MDLITDKEKLADVNDPSKEAAHVYDDLIATFILISTSEKSRKEKFVLIEKWRNKIRTYNTKFAEEKTRQIYLKYSGDAFNEAKSFIDEIDVKKKLLIGQKEELENLAQQLEIGLNKRLDALTEQAKQLALRQDLTKIQEKKLGYKDATDRTQITPKKAVKNLLFTNKEGKIVSMQSVMKFTVGDQLWSNITTAQRTQWLLLGFIYGTHISVMDDKTTIICRSLNLTRRDLRKDKLPPMHNGCRSKIKLSKEGWDESVFLKNFK